MRSSKLNIQNKFASASSKKEALSMALSHI